MQIPLQVTAGTSSHPELQWSDVESSHWLVSLWEEKKKNPCRIPCIFQIVYAIADQSQCALPAGPHTTQQIICCNSKNPHNLGISWKYIFLWSQ